MLQNPVFLEAIQSPFTLFEPRFAQRAAIAVALVCVLAAALGPTIILRDLPFFTHAIGAGAYPALVLAVAVGISLSIAAVAGGIVFASVLWVITRGATSPDRRDALTGIAVAAALGAGAVLSSTVATGNLRLAAPPEALLFGSVLTVTASTLVVTGAVAVAVAVAASLTERWLAGGFDTGVASQLGVAKLDGALLLVVALAAGATLPITGSLLAGSLLVVPAATARLVTNRAAAMTPITFLLALVEGALGLYLSLAFDLPAGATIAATTGTGFVIVAAGLAAAKFARRGSIGRVAAPLAVVALLALSIGGCGSSSDSSSSANQQAINVVATTTQVGDLVKTVGGDAVNVTTLLPAGTDPHEFEPKPSAVAALAKADVIFRSGGDVDAWLEPAVKAAGNSRKPVDLSNAATLLSESGSADAFNAHWFLSAANLAAASQRVRDELIKSDPNARETLRANATAYLNDIDTTDQALRACVEKLPKSERAILTGHDDFDYLVQGYALKIAGQLAETGESEPSVKDVQDAADAARKGGAKALVVSKGEAEQLAVQVAKQLDIPLLQLYSDSLAKSGSASTAWARSLTTSARLPGPLQMAQ